LAQEGEFIRAVHGTGGVDEEYEVEWWAIIHGRKFALDGDVDQLGVGVPWGFEHVDRRLERVRAVRGGVGVGEIVDQFFDADGIPRGSWPRVNEERTRE